jgi:hypothetical protein
VIMPSCRRMLGAPVDISALKTKVHTLSITTDNLSGASQGLVSHFMVGKSYHQKKSYLQKNK